MLLAAAGCGLIAFVVCISGIHGRTTNCVLQGSSVNLTCSAKTKTSTSSIKWFREHSNGGHTELPAGERHVIDTSDENQPTLTISNLTMADAVVYCCGNPTNPCVHSSTQLNVTELLVKSSQDTSRKTQLTCSTSCDLTESPAAYIWYINKNNEKSVSKTITAKSSHVQDTYSCSVSGYGLRAPEFVIEPKSDKHKAAAEAAAKAAAAAAGAAGASAALLVVILAIIFVWIRTKRTLVQPSTTEESPNTEQLSSSHLYENIPAQPPQPDELYYSTIIFQPKERDHDACAVFSPDV